MWNFLREHPRLTISMCVAGCMPLADCFLKRKVTKGLIRPVYAKMEVGSKPTIPLRSTVIGRPEVLESGHWVFAEATRSGVKGRG